MWFSSWLAKRQRSTTKGRSRTSSRQRPTCRPRLEALEDRWLPSQVGLTVTSLADSGTGTLRAAILTADAGSPSDKFTIGFAVNGTINLQSPLPDLDNTIAIQGPGASSLIVERAAGFSFASAIVTVDASQTASLSGLTITNGNAGGVVNNGTLTVVNSAVVNNPDATFFGAGGGILNTGTLTVSGSTVSGNSAGFGGGIMNTSSGLGATLTVTDSTVAGNCAQLVGGGILNGRTMTVSGSTVCGNSADLGGGIYSDGGVLTVRDCVFTGNSATEGGGIYNNRPATLEVQGSTFSLNTASDSGGAIYNLGAATLQQCTLSGNTAGSNGGGIFNAASGTLSVKDSAVLHNLAPVGADIYNLGALSLDDSTVGVIDA